MRSLLEEYFCGNTVLDEQQKIEIRKVLIDVKNSENPSIDAAQVQISRIVHGDNR